MSASDAFAAGKPRRRSSWQHFSLQNAGTLLALLILLGTVLLWLFYFHRKVGTFPGRFELTSLVNTATPLALAAIGQTLVVLTRGIDLSVGGVIDLSNSLAASHMHSSLGSMIGWSIVVLLVGAAGGLVNGLLVAYARLQPILVTLATLSIFQGLALRVLPQPGGAIPAGYTKALANPTAPWSFLYILAAVGGWLLFRRTSFGIGVIGLGNDEHAAQARGIAVRRVKVCVYVCAGMLGAAAGLFSAATDTAGDATSGDVFILTSIAAVVLGGVSFLGGRGSAIGTIAGAFTLTILVNVLFFAGIDPLYQSFYQGLFLVVAVVLGILVGRLARVSS